MCCTVRSTGDATLRPLAEAVRKDGTASVASETADQWFAPGAEQSHRLEVARILRSISEADSASYAYYIEALDSHRIGDHLGEISLPVLSIWGEHDTGNAKAKMQFVVDGVQRGTLVGIQGAGHVPPVEQPVKVAEVLREFFLQNR